jgi:hypothetical protein
VTYQVSQLRPGRGTVDQAPCHVHQPTGVHLFCATVHLHISTPVQRYLLVVTRMCSLLLTCQHCCSATRGDHIRGVLHCMCVIIIFSWHVIITSTQASVACAPSCASWTRTEMVREHVAEGAERHRLQAGGAKRKLCWCGSHLSIGAGTSAGTSSTEAGRQFAHVYLCAW